MHQIEQIDLRPKPIPHPGLTFLIDEEEFGVTTDTKLVHHITTHGLIYCRAIIFYHPQTTLGLMCHTFRPSDPELLIEKLAELYSHSLSQSDVWVVSGHRQHEYAPTIDEFIAPITKKNPGRLRVEDNLESGLRSVTVNLQTGDVRLLTNPESHLKLNIPQSPLHIGMNTSKLGVLQRKDPSYGEMIRLKDRFFK